MRAGCWSNESWPLEIEVLGIMELGAHSSAILPAKVWIPADQHILKRSLLLRAEIVPYSRAIVWTQVYYSILLRVPRVIVVIVGGMEALMI